MLALQWATSSSRVRPASHQLGKVVFFSIVRLCIEGWNSHRVTASVSFYPSLHLQYKPLQSLKQECRCMFICLHGKTWSHKPFLLTVSGARLRTQLILSLTFRQVKGHDGRQGNIKFSPDTLHSLARNHLRGLCTDWWVGFLEFGGWSWTEGYKPFASKQKQAAQNLYLSEPRGPWGRVSGEAVGIRISKSKK